MNQPFMTFDQALAEKSGAGGGIQEGGAYVCTIESAVYKKAGTGSHGVEFTIKTDEGLTGRYLTAYFAKADNTPIGSGQSLLNALMGFCNIQGLTWAPTKIEGQDASHCPELKGKKVGLFLQKRLYTKDSGEEAYSFEIRCPFDAQTQQTFKEKAAGKNAEAIARMIASYKDKDDRSAPTMAQQQAPQGDGFGPMDNDFPYQGVSNEKNGTSFF